MATWFSYFHKTGNFDIAKCHNSFKWCQKQNFKQVNMLKYKCCFMTISIYNKKCSTTSFFECLGPKLNINERT